MKTQTWKNMLCQLCSHDVPGVAALSGHLLDGIRGRCVKTLQKSWLKIAQVNQITQLPFQI